MHVLRTVVPDALLLDPGTTPAARSAGPAGHTDPAGPTDTTSTAGFVVHRRRRPAHDAVHGLHAHPDEPTLLGVPCGTGYAVLVDTRPASATFGRLAVALLDGPRTLLVPPGCLYGVQALCPGTLVELRSPARPSRRERITVDPDDPDLNIRWLRPLPARTPDADRSWAGLCSRLGAPTGPRREHVSLW